MKLSLLSLPVLSLIGFATVPTTVLAHGDEVHEDHLAEELFSYKGTEAEYDHCELEYSNGCSPAIPIEVAACEAPLVVFGRVIKIDTDETSDRYGQVQINVNYETRLFSGSSRNKVPKWGAGLENEVNGTDFFDESGFFTAWVDGFLPPNTRVTNPNSTCGTLLPFPQDEMYFFLTSDVPEGEYAGLNDNSELSVDLMLSTTVLRSGTAEKEAWDYVNEGIFNDDIKLQGNCKVAYCCYYPDCSECEGLLEQYPGYSCPDYTIKPAKEDSAGNSATVGFASLVFGATIFSWFMTQLF